MKPAFRKILNKSWSESKYRGHEVTLTGVQTLEGDLILTDLKTNACQRNYQMRYDNLVQRFLAPNSGRVKVVFSTTDVNQLISAFLRKEKCDNIVIRQGEIACTYSPWSEQEGKIVFQEVGETTARDPDTEKETKVPAVKSVIVKMENDEEIEVPLDNWGDGMRVEFAKSNNLIGMKVTVKKYVVYDKVGYLISQKDE